MDIIEFKSQMAEVPERDRRSYSKLAQYACVGGNVWPQYQKHLDASGTLREFFEAVYADDACRFDNAWAAWARMQRKRWTERFEPERMVRDVPFTANGILIEKDGLELVIAVPVTGKRKRADVLVFPENGFNEAAADQVASINGRFACAGMTFDGTYDIFVSDRALILEQWELDKLGYRKNDKRASKSS